MKVLRWGSKYPFSEYVLNRYYHLFESIMGCETDLEDFIDFLHDHHLDKDPIFPDLLWTNDHWTQLYESFKTEIGELLLCLNSQMIKKISHLEPSRKALLASELIIMQYLDRVGGYVFKSANFTNLIDYCMTSDL